MYEGSCLCGNVKFEIHTEITDIIHCHCSLCRKSSGTAYATNGFVNADKFNLVQGKNQINFFELRPGKKRHFCLNCASPIFSSNDSDVSRIRIRLGVIDSPIMERPLSHNFVTSKACWDNLDDQLPRYEGLEPSRSK
ncbi:GFA family protein [Parashewanella spongiae]|uniref:GFA family protein n=1 Tax=Parashewanella spongiae TaxID=342950 RepID=A0A3A6TRE5_9GAMM|nr:GFA family protein [Parashewanella spongiae]MCL1079075.1 GFA family protein [Parashewanella spongiae]RJY07851.1 GFA family protein [Parashewanella spongiae]